MTKHETFSSRWALLLAALGMVIGTGNIWRFPRVVAKNGGGAFLIVWFLFLFLWSIPLLITEFALGKATRRGTIGAIRTLIGPGATWMGAFIGFCTTAIMCYYAVVMGWCMRFFTASLTDSFVLQSPDIFWHRFLEQTWQPILCHAVAISIGAVVVLKGITKGIEKTNNILIPTLILLLVIAAVRALTLPGAAGGLDFLFSPDWKSLLHYRVWLEALSQSAWSTGAAWGLLLTYAVYSREKEDIVLNAFLAGLGNNAASLLVGLSIFPAVFALAPVIGVDPNNVITETGPASTGMAFIWMPRLFNQMPGASLFTALFFLSLTIAALTSLIAMIEMAVRNLIDLGLTRPVALVSVWTLALLAGIPSAANIDIFQNQDWVWGLGLVVNGFFLIFAMYRYNPKRFRQEFINTPSNDIHLGRWFDWIVRYIMPAEFFFLLGWWFYQAIAVYEPEAWWHPLQTFSVGTCLFQWGVAITLFVLLNGWIVARIDRQNTI